MEEQGMEEFDIEVNDLHTNKPVSHPLASQDTSAKAISSSQRAHFLRRLLIGCCLILAIAILLVTNTALGSFLRNPRHFGAASAHTQAEPVWVAHIVPWGKLSIDKQAYHSVSDGSELFLAWGAHNLRYEAQPFAPLHCVFHIPLSKTDTCPHFTGDANTEYPAVASPSQILDLGATPTALPANQQAELIAAAQHLLDKAKVNISVPPGEYIAAAGGRNQVAPEETTVTLTYHLRIQYATSTGQGAPGSPDGSCAQFCVVPAQSQQAQFWELSVPIWLRWQYISANGMPIVVESPPTQDAQLDFLVSWTNGWDVQFKDQADTALSMAMCSLQQARISSLAESLPANISILSINPVPAARPTGSCLTVLIVQNGTSQSPYWVSLFFRNGTLLTVDQTAHALFPSLPMADSYEQSLAAQLLKGTPIGS